MQGMRPHEIRLTPVPVPGAVLLGILSLSALPKTSTSPAGMILTGSAACAEGTGTRLPTATRPEVSPAAMILTISAASAVGA